MSNLIKLSDIDCIFLSYDEPNAEKNYADLLTKAPWALRVHGVKGSDAAHKACADLSGTERFITVDGDNIVDPIFFDQHVDLDQWRSGDKTQLSWAGRNHINGLVYGNGGLKCWTREHVWNMKTHEAADNDTNQVDFCWNDNYQHLSECYSVSYNNASALQAFRAGFREGVKMCLKDGIKPAITRFNTAAMINNFNRHRLSVWMSVGADVMFGNWATYGARLGTCMTMLTDWDYHQVRDFTHLTNLFIQHEKDDVLVESLRLGELIRDKLKLEVADLDAPSSRCFKSTYINLPRTAREPMGYVTAIPLMLDSLDVIFIANGESNADENWQQLLKVYPAAKRIDNVNGIYAAHKVASESSSTELFFIVDADAWVLDSFKFEINGDEIGDDMVYVWHSLNPVNLCVYGYGGVKLFSKQMFSTAHDNIVDMTTTIAKYIKVIPEISCVTKFNTSEYDAWRSGFRECAKLASKSIAGQVDTETEQRLQAWLTRGVGTAFGEYTIAGARAGQKFGLENAGTDRMQLINDYNFLKEQFNNDN
jgi:hypothetical protein